MNAAPNECQRTQACPAPTLSLPMPDVQEFIKDEVAHNNPQSLHCTDRSCNNEKGDEEMLGIKYEIREGDEIKSEEFMGYSVAGWCELGPSAHVQGHSPGRSDLDDKEDIKRWPDLGGADVQTQKPLSIPNMASSDLDAGITNTDKAMSASLTGTSVDNESNPSGISSPRLAENSNNPAKSKENRDFSPDIQTVPSECRESPDTVKEGKDQSCCLQTFDDVTVFVRDGVEEKAVIENEENRIEDTSNTNNLAMIPGDFHRDDHRWAVAASSEQLIEASLGNALFKKSAEGFNQNISPAIAEKNVQASLQTLYAAEGYKTIGSTIHASLTTRPNFESTCQTAQYEFTQPPLMNYANPGYYSLSTIGEILYKNAYFQNSFTVKDGNDNVNFVASNPLLLLQSASSMPMFHQSMPHNLSTKRSQSTPSVTLKNETIAATEGVDCMQRSSTDTETGAVLSRATCLQGQGDCTTEVLETEIIISQRNEANLENAEHDVQQEQKMHKETCNILDDHGGDRPEDCIEEEKIRPKFKEKLQTGYVKREKTSHERRTKEKKSEKNRIFNPLSKKPRRDDFVDPTRVKLDQDDDIEDADSADRASEDTSDEDWMPKRKDKSRTADFPKTNGLGEKGDESMNAEKFSTVEKSRFGVVDNLKGRGKQAPSGLECHDCGKIFHGSYHLKRHLLSHTENRPFTCPTCGKKFKQKAHLQGHEAIHLREKSWVKNKNRLEAKPNASPNNKCPGRPKKVYSENELSCKLCNKTFKTLYRLKRHVQSHTDVRPYTCRVCGKGFKQTGHRNEHEANHEKNRRKFLCNMCGVIFRCRSSFNNHLKSHRQNRDVLEKEKASDGSVISGGASSTAEGGVGMDLNLQHTGYDCPYCVDKFATAQGLNRHMESHIEVHQRLHVQPYSCHVCCRSFTYKHNLAKHMLTHQAPEKYAEFHKSKLEEHLASGKPSFTCPTCFKVFMRKETLAKHSKIHSGSKPFKCLVCHKEFTQNVHMKVHMRKHTGNRPFQCKKCNRGFIDSTALAKHIEYEACNSENMLFHCTICDKRHYYLGSIKQHIKKEHKKQDVDKFISRTQRHRRQRVTSMKKDTTCKICSTSFTEKGNLIRHVKRKHGDLLKMLDDEHNEQGLNTSLSHINVWTKGTIGNNSEMTASSKGSPKTTSAAGLDCGARHETSTSIEDKQLLAKENKAVTERIPNRPSSDSHSQSVKNSFNKNLPRNNDVEFNRLDNNGLPKSKLNDDRNEKRDASFSMKKSSENLRLSIEENAAQNKCNELCDSSGCDEIVSLQNCGTHSVGHIADFDETHLTDDNHSRVDSTKHNQTSDDSRKNDNGEETLDEEPKQVNTEGENESNGKIHGTDVTASSFLFHVGLVEKTKAAQFKHSDYTNKENHQMYTDFVSKSSESSDRVSSNTRSSFYENESMLHRIPQNAVDTPKTHSAHHNTCRNNLEVLCDLALMTENRPSSQTSGDPSNALDWFRSKHSFLNEFQVSLNTQQNLNTLNSTSSVTESQLEQYGLLVCRDAQLVRSRQRPTTEVFAEHKPWLEQLLGHPANKARAFGTEAPASTESTVWSKNNSHTSDNCAKSQEKIKPIDLLHKACLSYGQEIWPGRNTAQTIPISKKSPTPVRNFSDSDRHGQQDNLESKSASKTHSEAMPKHLNVSATTASTGCNHPKLQIADEQISPVDAGPSDSSRTECLPVVKCGKEASAQTPLYINPLPYHQAGDKNKLSALYREGPGRNNILHRLLDGAKSNDDTRDGSEIWRLGSGKDKNSSDNNLLLQDLLPLNASIIPLNPMEPLASCPPTKGGPKASAKGPFPCMGCGKCFNARHQLKRHEMTHSEIRPYRCSECGKAFRQKVHLSDHLKRHRGQRPFVCQACGKRFVLKNELKQHIKNYCRKEALSRDDVSSSYKYLDSNANVNVNARNLKCLLK